MERLTKTLDNGRIVTTEVEDLSYGETVDGCFLNYFTGEAINRLAAYEDIVNLDVNKLYPDAKITMYGKPLSHWQELSKAEQDGRLVVLPCKVGDTVWEIGYDCKIDYEDMCSFPAPSCDECEFVKRVIVPVRVDSVTAATFLIGKIGTTAFFSLEDAEAALEGVNEDA